MSPEKLPLDQVLEGDCIELLAEFPPRSVDLIFADPPYNLQLSKELWRPNQTRVDAVDDDWDDFDSFEAYDAFTNAWLKACRRVLKDDGALWVIGTYHNIYRVGRILQDLGFWTLNDVVWIKTNPMPNFRGVRFTNAHETLLWVTKGQGASYTFNYHALKRLNGGKQMRSDWVLPVCGGSERIRLDGEKAHSTQKPEALLYRVILAASDPGDVVLDPFFGTGTTGAVAKRLHRRWIGIERERSYAELARERLEAVEPETFLPKTFDIRDERRKKRRVPFARLLELGLLDPGAELLFKRDAETSARVKPDGRLVVDGFEGSIHQAGKHLQDGSPCNGWDHWFYRSDDGEMKPIDALRERAREMIGAQED
ncbi:MAG: site-specific DNA-methyltransferase [Anaerolineales bacterium]|nr:site-specific DNA-methyltransferase [Anaerolineales bacterium]